MNRSSNQSDEQLMLAYAKQADQQAFEQLYRRHKGPLYRYLYRQTHDRGNADELFQEVWINLIKARHRYKVQAKFSTYLFRIAHNRLIDFYRRKKLPQSYANELDPDELAIDKRQQPERLVATGNCLEKLLVLLEALPEAQREVFLLKEEAGLSLEQLAEVLSVNKETVKSRLRYARDKLRRGMLGNSGEV